MAGKIKLKNIRQVVTFSASPRQIYLMLMDSKKHAKFSGEPAKIGKRVGSKISAYGGWIEGKNLKLIPDSLIVQAWRGADWPKGHWSKATFLLSKTKNGTKLTFDHTGVPVEKFKGINSGWKSQYWAKMKKQVSKSK